MLRKRHKEIFYLNKSILLEESGITLFNRIVIWTILIFVALFFVWTSSMKVDEVAEASGEIVPFGSIKKVQHIEGGVISSILVKDGDIVSRGKDLITLDRTKIKLQQDENEVQLTSLYKKRRLLREQVKVTENLLSKGLSTKMSMLTITNQFNDVEMQIAELKQTEKKLINMMDNSIIRAPSDGVVHGLQVHTIGGVIEAGQVLMQIVPLKKELIAEVKISSSDIGHVKIGSSALLKFAAYDFTKYGGIDSVIKEISPTTLIDSLGNPYYKGIAILKNEFLGNDKLFAVLPGMTLRAEIKTGEKTILQYLLKPIYSSAIQSFRER